MPRLLHSFFLAFFALLAGCGLSEKERSVAAANEAIEAVSAAQEVVAEEINNLPDGEVTADSLAGVRESLGTYIEQVEALNAALRGMVDHYPDLDSYLNGTFRPSAEAAIAACQEASEELSAEEPGQDDIQRALTRIGLCLDRYATAVTNVAHEYGRISN